MPVSFDSFTEQELRRLQQNLRRRFAAARIIDVAFGPGETAGRLDPRRPFSVVCLVARKRNPRDPQQRLPSTVDCRLKRDNRFQTFRLPVDVVESRAMRLTGRELKRPDKSSRVTTGTVVSWSERGRRLRRWAVVSVGHYFPPGTGTGQSISLFRTAGNRIFGELLFVSNARSRLDAAVIGFAKQDLRNARLVPANRIPDLKPRSIAQIKRDIGKTGNSLIPPRDQTIAVRFVRYLPSSDNVREIWTIRHVVQLSSAVRGTFRGGHSGTVMTTRRGQVALMQYAGTRGAARDGLGQAEIAIMQWLDRQLARRFDLVPGSLRLISRF